MFRLMPGCADFLRCIHGIRACSIHVDIAGRWQVSSCGRVCNTRGQISFGNASFDGYRRVIIEQRSLLVHRLVARAFLGIPPSPSHSQVNHKDGNRSNNRVQNLEYLTPTENMVHSYANGRNCFSKPVLWRRVGDSFWNLCRSQSQMARELGVHQSSVSRICRQGFGQTVGFEFKFAEQDSDAIRHEVYAGDYSGEEWRQACHPKTGEAIDHMMVSTLGRVSKSTGRISHGTLNAAGYCVTNGKDGSFRVHRLVAATFLGLPMSPSLQVHHIDGNRRNNCINNLEYATPSENCLDAQSRSKGYRSGKPILGRCCSESAWVRFSSVSEAARAANVSFHFVVWACKHEAALRNGWTFKPVMSTDVPGEEWRDVIMPDCWVRVSVSEVLVSASWRRTPSQRQFTNTTPGV
ncbi:unnamed protein product [Symbiodinium natans]|uniref:HNH nuclease domain-containing protein n=1 Tax=Symbiodinium natans TaxID=878477 RepID=A0A812Q4X3_9DINO|nr:unnamed protein product [Symbiodinium natans]